MKKRELLPYLEAAIMRLSKMSGDVSNLEIMDNDQSSRRLKRDLISFRNNELAVLEKEVSEIREIIKSRPKRQIRNSGINIGKAIAAKASLPRKDPAVSAPKPINDFNF